MSTVEAQKYKKNQRKSTEKEQNKEQNKSTEKEQKYREKALEKSKNVLCGEKFCFLALRFFAAVV